MSCRGALDALFDTETTLFAGKKGRALALPRPLAPLVDTHAHLTIFKQQTAARALARAALAGVRAMGVPADPSEDARDAGVFFAQLDAALKEAEALVEACVAEAGQSPAARVDAAAGAAAVADAAMPGVGAADAAAASAWSRYAELQSLQALFCRVRVFSGVHPYGAEAYLKNPQVQEAFEQLLQHPRTVGVGEIGLDYHCEVSKSAQRQAFAAQLARAVELNVPVELHIRDAQDDERAQAHLEALEILDEVGMPAAGVDLHCFTSNPAVLAPYVERGCYVAFGGALTFKATDQIRAACLACPESALLSETDCPFMAPVPLRGREAEPAVVAFTAAYMADLRQDVLGVSRTSTYEMLFKNGRSLLQV